jgi:hypothetical protein
MLQEAYSYKSLDVGFQNYGSKLAVKSWCFFDGVDSCLVYIKQDLKAYTRYKLIKLTF